MEDFRKQIKEDIQDYKETYLFKPNIQYDSWAFNFWILDKLYYVDEEMIDAYIIENNDMGIDAYVFYEDTKDLFLIQNKYYSDSSKLKSSYVKNDFLLKGINALKNGTYTRSEELQDIYNKYKNDNDFKVYLELNVTNNIKCEDGENYIKKFNIENNFCIANINYLKDIENKYYNEIKINRNALELEVYSVNKGTILNVNTEAYKLQNIADAKYVYTPITCIYEMYQKAIEKEYPLFDANIREYLGQKGSTNKKIYETLIDKEDRKNFFYYNNGITIICDKIGKIKTSAKKENLNAVFKISNPQIVNGCQTVNTINQVLKNVKENDLDSEFGSVFVMLKILEINDDNEKENKLYRNIVTYNNSQNKIDEKSFVANEQLFLRIQEEFSKKGFLLLIKQSDKNQFKTKYKFEELRKLNEKSLSLFDLKGNIKKIEDLYIPLEKLLQVILSITENGYKGYIKKSNLLKKGSDEYIKVTDFIKDPNITIDMLLKLYLLYKKFEVLKKNEKNGDRYPISLYSIESFFKHECLKNGEKIAKVLKAEEDVEKILKIYTITSKSYCNDFGDEYNKMIKQPIKYELWSKKREEAIDIIETHLI